MKIKITKPDGTLIEAEGTAEEVAIALRDHKPDNVPQPIWIAPVQPVTPWWWTQPTTTSGGLGAVSTSIVVPNPADAFSYTDGGAS